MLKISKIIILLSLAICRNDGEPPNFVELPSIIGFSALETLEITVIVTDRNPIEKVTLFYRFGAQGAFTNAEMAVSTQPVIYEYEIPSEEVESAGIIEYYFFAKDIYGNGQCFNFGGYTDIDCEDQPFTEEIGPAILKKQEQNIDEISVDIKPPVLDNKNLPDYIDISLLAPELNTLATEGIPIIAISIFDPEERIDVDSTIVFIDKNKVVPFLSADMITYVPSFELDPGFHVIRLELQEKTDKKWVHELLFFIEEVSEEVAQLSWNKRIKLKGNLSWNGDFDPSPSKPSDTHKLNTSFKFNLGDYKFNISGLTSLHIYDAAAREATKRRQPSTRLKFKMNSPNWILNYGDNSPEFSSFSLKGTRVRGLFTKFIYGTWETSFVSGETKHWVDDYLKHDDIKLWDSATKYYNGDKVYWDGEIWELKVSSFLEETFLGIPVASTQQGYAGIEPCEDDAGNCTSWVLVEDSNYTEIPNNTCSETFIEMYGANPDTFRTNIAFGEPALGYGGGIYWIWNGDACEEVLIYSSINMFTGEDGNDNGELFSSYSECRSICTVPIQYQKGFPKQYLQGFRTSKEFYEYAKFGISAIRSWGERNANIVPYPVLEESYQYIGNTVLSSDFFLHFNHDKTILSGEYGISITMDQALGSEEIIGNSPSIIKAKEDVAADSAMYSYENWEGLDYCYQNNCVDINGDGEIITAPEIIPGWNTYESLWSEINNTQDDLESYAHLMGYEINDDIIGFGELEFPERGFSGLTGREFSNLVSGGLDSLHLLFKRPTYNIKFKTPIPLYFTELDFKFEYSQAPKNFISLGSSSVQQDVKMWKGSFGFNLFKNQLKLSYGLDQQIKSPFAPEPRGVTKRSHSNSYSASVGLGIKKLPTINYSIKYQVRRDSLIFNKATTKEQFVDSDDNPNEIWDEGEEFTDLNGNGQWDENILLENESLGLTKMYTHTLAPSHKIKLGDVKVGLNGNISFVNDIDIYVDQAGCYEILNNTSGPAWGGLSVSNQDTNYIPTNVWDDPESFNCEKYKPNLYYFTKENNPLSLEHPLFNAGNLTSTYTGALSFSFKFPLSINLGYGITSNTPFDKRESETIITLYSFKAAIKLFDKAMKLTLGSNYVIGKKTGDGFYDSGEDFIDIPNGQWDEGDVYIDTIPTDETYVGEWNEGEEFTDCGNDLDGSPICEGDDNWDSSFGNGIWDTEEPFVDLGNGQWDEGEEYTDTIGNGAWDFGESFTDKEELNNSKASLKFAIQYKIPDENITLSLNMDYSKSVDKLRESPPSAYKAKLAIKYGF